MIDVINTCFETTIASRPIAYYSHLIPSFFALAIGIFVYIKTNKSFLSKIFMGFVATFSVWLLADMVVWTSNSYTLVYTFWAPLDLIEIVFYAVGLYFFAVFLRGSDISLKYKVLLFISILPALIISVMGNSVLDFQHFWCEATNSIFLTNYKLAVEIVYILIIGLLTIKFALKSDPLKKKAILIFGGSIFGFLAVFGVAEYLASVTAFYELHLYSLFTLPIFLLIIIYSIFDLDIFKFKILKTHFLVVGFLALMTSQIFFIQDSTDKLLTLFTVLLAFGFSFLLFKNLKKESDQRVRIEKLSDQLEKSNFQLSDANEKLKDLDKSKTEFLSLASHQLRSPLTAIKGYSSMLLDGSYGEIQEKNKMPIDRIFQSANNLTLIVEDLLSVTKIEQGGMQYEFTGIDLAKVAKMLVEEQSVNAKNRGLELVFDNKIGTAIVRADATKIRQVLLNFVDNAIKYTPKGSVSVTVESIDGNKVRFAVKDSGVGMSEETKHNLFEKFKRGEEGSRIDSGGSGLGLYLAKEIVGAHAGEIHVESDGVGKGSTFIVDLPLKN
ncbi:MAG: sensor signal transduction histidine kinase, partial [Bacteroidota bacterium]|nr:sensor signal transduction histidine kinase [Bacteroidota bacterium]